MLMLTLFGLTLSEARLEKVRCDLLTNVFEDPIVSPGIRSAHLHSVFGAETFAQSHGRPSPGYPFHPTSRWTSPCIGCPR
jgi:hypothetical protein